MEKNEIFRKSNLERISSPEQLNEYIRVINPSVVLVIVGLAVVLVGGVIWAMLGNIPVTLDAQGALYESGGQLSMVCVVPTDQTGKLRQGMEVQVSPEIAPRDSYGYLKGTISQISQYPVSLDELSQVMGNEQLARAILPAQPGVEITVVLERDGDDYAWSNEKGRSVELKPGMLGSAFVVIKNQRPIELIFDSEGE